MYDRLLTAFAAVFLPVGTLLASVILPLSTLLRPAVWASAFGAVSHGESAKPNDPKRGSALRREIICLRPFQSCPTSKEHHARHGQMYPHVPGLSPWAASALWLALMQRICLPMAACWPCGKFNRVKLLAAGANDRWRRRPHPTESSSETFPVLPRASAASSPRRIHSVEPQPAVPRLPMGNSLLEEPCDVLPSAASL